MLETMESMEKEASGSTPEKVESRFGMLEYHSDFVIDFVNGILGFENFKSYCLCVAPQSPKGEFLLLHCLDQNMVTFMVLPLGMENSLIEQKDLEEACAHYKFDPKHTQVYSTISVAGEGAETVITTNLRAPILIDEKLKKGVQHVLSNSKYAIRDQITKLA